MNLTDPRFPSVCIVQPQGTAERTARELGEHLRHLAGKPGERFTGDAPAPVRRRSLASIDCTVRDDRTDSQLTSHRWAIVAKDRCMSGWGGASGGVSRCAWACAPEVNTDRVFNWVRARSDMSYVALVNLNTYRAPRGTAHFHVYVCNADHVAARY